MIQGISRKTKLFFQLRDQYCFCCQIGKKTELPLNYVVECSFCCQFCKSCLILGLLIVILLISSIWKVLHWRNVIFWLWSLSTS